MARLEARYRPPTGPAVVLWVRDLPPGAELVLGREDDPAASPAEWGVARPEVPADHRRHVSTRHLTVRWDGSRLRARRRKDPPPANEVRLLASGAEPPDPFAMSAGEGVRIEEFEFRLLDPAPPATRAAPPADGELMVEFDPRDYRPDGRFVNPDGLVAALRVMIGRCDLLADDRAFAAVALNALLGAIPAASGAALLTVPDPVSGEDPTAACEQSREPGPVRFSRRQAWRVVANGTGVISTRDRADSGGTVVPETDWGVYVPVEAGGPVGAVAYACGRFRGMFDGATDLAAHPDLARAREATQLVAEVYAVLCRLRLQRAAIDELMRFLPQPVRALSDRGPLGPELEPRVVPVTVLFCDLRGSCGLAEGGDADLARYWWAVLHKALNLMAEAVVEHGGVIGSFLGDAVMAFWGWPEAGSDQAERAARAASSIWRRFARAGETDPAVGRLGFGIGIAHGPAFAGRLGTPDQPKVDVIGPTVNLAARLEGLTKPFGVRALLDATAVALLPGELRRRTRRVGRVVPYGITGAVELHALHTRLDEPVAETTRRVCGRYDRALELFESGEWAAAREALGPILGADGPAGYVASLIGTAEAPPADWPREPGGACVIPMRSK